MGVTGLKIVTPSTPADAKGLLRPAIRDDNPVSSSSTSACTGSPATSTATSCDRRGPVAREGTDITIVSAMNGVHESLKAADLLAADGISAEVIDLRTLRPLDIPTSWPRSPRRTGSSSSRKGRSPEGGPGRSRARHRGGPRRPRRRVAHRDGRQPGAVQAPARGRVPAGRRTDRVGDPPPRAVSARGWRRDISWPPRSLVTR